MTAQAATAEQTPPPSAEPAGVALLGAVAIQLVRSGLELYSVFVHTLYYTVKGRYERGAVVKHMHFIGNKSLFFISVVMGFIGMIFVLQAGLQIQRAVPDTSQIGATYIELLVRALAPTIIALMLATRVGAGIAAEIGSMVVTEQVDALRMCAADPIDYLIKPRFVASVLMTVIVVIWGTGVAYLTGLVTGNVFFAISPGTFMNFSLVDAGDLTVCLAKCFAYGAAIPIVSGHCGLYTFGGSEGVGWATTRSVVNSSLTIIILDFVISAIGYILFP